MGCQNRKKITLPVDEIQTVYDITGKFPAIRGHDYINESSNKRENQLIIEWWKSGGIPTLMWHRGASSGDIRLKQIISVK
jgi:hypothetical protein